MKKSNNIFQDQPGFTLVELLIAMVVALLVSGAVYASYKVQQQTHIAQMQVTRIQQNLRAAMEMMSSDFRFAGFDPYQTGSYEVLAGTGPNNFQFTADLCEDGNNPKPAATTPCFDGPYSKAPPLGMGIQNMSETFNYMLTVDDTLTREAIAGSTIAENIEFVEFYYILANGAGTLAPSTAQRPCIRSVRVTLVGRADQPDYKYTNTDTYPRGSGAVYDPPDDNYRRRSMTKTIELRNMGITFAGSTCS